MSCVTKEIGVVAEEQTLVRHIGARHALPRIAAVLIHLTEGGFVFGAALTFALTTTEVLSLRVVDHALGENHATMLSLL